MSFEGQSEWGHVLGKFVSPMFNDGCFIEPTHVASNVTHMLPLIGYDLTKTMARDRAEVTAAASKPLPILFHWWDHIDKAVMKACVRWRPGQGDHGTFDERTQARCTTYWIGSY